MAVFCFLAPIDFTLCARVKIPRTAYEVFCGKGLAIVSARWSTATLLPLQADFKIYGTVNPPPPDLTSKGGSRGLN